MSDARRRILLAEDEQSIVASLTFLLDRAGFEVTVETNGVRAVEMALANPPALMVLDVMLPGIDGFEALRRLRAEPAGRAIPIVMLTAKGQREDRETALRLGANEFITKPFANADVVDAALRLARVNGHGEMPGEAGSSSADPGATARARP